LTLDYIPYAKITDDQKMVDFVTEGGRLSKEEVTCECPDALWSIVVRCWSTKLTDRPTFCSLVAALQTLRDEEVSRKMLSAGATTAKEAQERAAKEAKERGRCVRKAPSGAASDARWGCLVFTRRLVFTLPASSSQPG
jgi:hypothetical protein